MDSSMDVNARKEAIKKRQLALKCCRSGNLWLSVIAIKNGREKGGRKVKPPRISRKLARANENTKVEQSQLFPTIKGRHQMSSLLKWPWRWKIWWLMDRLGRARYSTEYVFKFRGWFLPNMHRKQIVSARHLQPKCLQKWWWTTKRGHGFVHSRSTCNSTKYKNEVFKWRVEARAEDPQHDEEQEDQELGNLSKPEDEELWVTDEDDNKED